MSDVSRVKVGNIIEGFATHNCPFIASFTYSGPLNF
jgi:hypothetical protein